MSESLMYGTVGGRVGNHRLYPEADGPPDRFLGLLLSHREWSAAHRRR
jgi:hypothetical protein